MQWPNGLDDARRIEKIIACSVPPATHVIAEYDGNNNLLRKYIFGPSIDQPVCMIEVADANAVYYYHFDALGSVVAMSDAAGDTVQTCEYFVYGEVAVEDANHPNPYMFTGRRWVHVMIVGGFFRRPEACLPIIAAIFR